MPFTKVDFPLPLSPNIANVLLLRLNTFDPLCRARFSDQLIQDGGKLIYSLRDLSDNLADWPISHALILQKRRESGFD